MTAGDHVWRKCINDDISQSTLKDKQFISVKKSSKKKMSSVVVETKFVWTKYC